MVYESHINFLNDKKTHLEILLKCRFWGSTFRAGACNSASLTSPQLLLALLVHTKRQVYAVACPWLSSSAYTTLQLFPLSSWRKGSCPRTRPWSQVHFSPSVTEQNTHGHCNGTVSRDRCLLLWKQSLWRGLGIYEEQETIIQQLPRITAAAHTWNVQTK